jgi:ATP-dependent Lon protease
MLETIPPALRDRMEVIPYSGYTEEDKVHIATEYLIPKQVETHGLTDKNILIEESALRKIIREYTREAGVRDIERKIASICRQVARKVVEGEKKRLKIAQKNLHDYLGPSQFRYGLAEEADEVGVATGLAWTEAGGDVLSVEATTLSGKGKLILTGHLGEVMRESAQAAVSYVRSRAEVLKIDKHFYSEFDTHIHVPGGAIPKDGPSAGITMATALASALTKRPVKRELAMTGEITLRGRVLPIGGVKEKVLAAHRAGIKEIILPEENEKDLELVSKEVREELKFHFVEHMDQVLELALRPETPAKRIRQPGKQA